MGQFNNLSIESKIKASVCWFYDQLTIFRYKKSAEALFIRAIDNYLSDAAFSCGVS